MSDPKVNIKVNVDGTDAVAGISRVSSHISGLKQAALSIPGVGTALLAVGSVAGIAATAFAGLKRSLDEFAQTEEGVARLEAALANVGHSTEENRGRLKGLADAMQEATGIADDEWLGAITRLIQAGSNPASVGMDLEAVKNLTAVVGNVSTATSLYARALQGSFEGLSRYGIVLNETGTLTEKLAELQSQAARRGAGVLEAATHTLTGQFRRLGNSVANAAEATGQWLAKTGIVQGLLWSASEVLSDYAAAAGQAYDELGLLNRQTTETADALKAYKEQADEVLRITLQSIKAINAEVEAMRAKHAMLDQLTDKQASLEKSRVDLEVAEGKITPKQGIKRKAMIDIASATEKARRQEEAALEEQRKQEEKVRLLAEKKAEVDRALKKEKETQAEELRRDKKRESIRALITEAKGGTFLEEATASSAATWEIGMGAPWNWLFKRGLRKRGIFRLFGGGEPEPTDPTSGVGAWVKDTEDRKTAREVWEKETLARTENKAPERESRIGELSRMSSELGGSLETEQKALRTLSPKTKIAVTMARADEAESWVQGSTKIIGAQGGDPAAGLATKAEGMSSQLGHSLQKIGMALDETIAVTGMAEIKANAALYQIQQLREQIKSTMNR